MELKNISKLHLVFLIIVVAALLLSAIHPLDYLSWFAEALPVILGVGTLIFIYKDFKFTNVIYVLVVFVSIFMVIGGHYTYPKVPIPKELNHLLENLFNFKRNHYDRIGHFFQGVTIAMISREVLIRKTMLRKNFWIYFVSITIALALAAFYELIEWAVAMFSNGDGGAFVGAQGDKWDAQWDMFMAFLGANTALVALWRLHNKMLKRLKD